MVGTGERSVEVVYAICSLPFEQARPSLIAAWLHDHWGIENAVHWVRDVTLDEDRSTVRTGTAPQVMASLRNTALNLHRLRGAGNIAEALPAHRPQQRPRRRPPHRPSNQQVTSVLINNAGALDVGACQLANRCLAEVHGDQNPGGDREPKTHKCADDLSSSGHTG